MEVMLSYTHQDEDIVINHVLRDFVIQGGGIFYVDVGANHPIKESVTEWFYRYADAKGINIEPQEEFIELLNIYRKRDINICAAAGAQSGMMPLYVNDNHSGCATLNEEYTDNTKIGSFIQSGNVKVMTLNEIWDQYIKQDVQFLKIDVEGYEKDVLEGLDLKAKRPWIICAECVKPFTNEDTSYLWEHLIIEQKYSFAGTYGINKFYVSEENARLLDRFLPLDEIKKRYHIFKIDDIAENHNVYDKRIQEIYNSTSWKITKPLRNLKMLLKKG